MTDRVQSRYRARGQSICRSVVGPEFFRLDAQIEQIGWAEDPESAAPLMRRAFELFRLGCERLRRDPKQYERLVDWDGPPSVQEAVREVYIDCTLARYPDCLALVLENHRSAGRKTDADACEKELVEFNIFLAGLWDL